MTAANITTKYDAVVMHLVPDIVKFAKGNASDWFSFSKYPGVIPLGGHTFTIVADTAANTEEAPVYGTMKANGAVASALTTSIVFDAAAAIRIVPYYLFIARTGEMVYVTADSGTTTTTGTLTVRRGVLGTTAAAIVDNDPMYVMNQLYVGSAAVGMNIMMVLPLPMEPGMKLFSEAHEA